MFGCGSGCGESVWVECVGCDCGEVVFMLGGCWGCDWEQ